jgi:hypothetical protein
VTGAVVTGARSALIVGVAATLVLGGGVAGGRSGARPIAPRNEIIAKLDAEAHLGKLTLPAGAARSGREPAGDGGALAHPFSGPPATPNVVDYHLWWVALGESPAAVLQYVEDHPPAGGQPGLAGSSSGSGRTSVTGIGFTWPAEPGRLGTRWLLVEAVALGGGSTGVRADSQVVWIKRRPASERIPVGSRRLVLTTTRFGRLIQGPLTFSSPDAIRRVVKLLNALPAEQPGAISCPLDRGSRIRLAFFGAARAWPLAVAVVDPSGCRVVRLTIHGRKQPPLIGGATLAGRLSHALGVKVVTGIPRTDTRVGRHGSRARRAIPGV